MSRTLNTSDQNLGPILDRYVEIKAAARDTELQEFRVLLRQRSIKSKTRSAKHKRLWKVRYIQGVGAVLEVFPAPVSVEQRLETAVDKYSAATKRVVETLDKLRLESIVNIGARRADRLERLKREP